MQFEGEETVRALAKALDDKKASDILAIHVADKTIIADWFLICSGRNENHVKALCDDLDDAAYGLGLEVRRKEGYNEGRWIVVDYGGILVHIFHPQERQYYNLERLWDSGDNTIDLQLEA